MQKRFTAIDFLRAIGILGVIATHVFSDNLTNSLNTSIWNYLHFVITSFVFCSGYVMWIAYKEKVGSLVATVMWYKKRLIRLLQPYYLYLLAHVGLVFLLPVYFSGLGIQKNWHYIWQSILLVGGINENWLPLLFIELAFLFPILLFLLKKVKFLFWLYILGGIGYTIFITLFPAPYSVYRWVMWIPWSLVFVLGWYFAQREKTKSSITLYFAIGLMSAFIFGLLTPWMSSIHRSLTLIDNKYPPNLFYLSYEFAISFLLLFISNNILFQGKWFVTLYTWLSAHSYGLFFVHFLFLDFILQVNKLYALHWNVWVQLLLVTIFSMSVIWVWERVQIRRK